MPTIGLFAGEVSGDLHGAHLARALVERLPQLTLAGIGGPQMAAAGVTIWADVTAHSAVGLTEQLPHVWPVLRAYKLARERILAARPDALVLIDYQGANVPLARWARAQGIPTIYYVLPQEWLWGLPGGARKVAEAADRLLAIFPREATIYAAAGGHVRHVGHPLMDMLAPVEAGTTPGATVALLPGSRAQELRALLPVFLAAARRVLAARPEARFVLPVSSPRYQKLVEDAVARAGLPVRVMAGRSAEAIAAADVVLAASGTATLEAAVLGVPCLAAYRVSPLTALLAKRLLRVPHVSLPNIVAERMVIPEFLQQQAAPGPLAEAVLKLLDDPRAREAQREGLAEVRARLGGPGAIARAADAVLETAGLAPIVSPLA